MERVWKLKAPIGISLCYYKVCWIIRMLQNSFDHRATVSANLYVAHYCSSVITTTSKSFVCGENY